MHADRNLEAALDRAGRMARRMYAEHRPDAGYRDEIAAMRDCKAIVHKALGLDGRSVWEDER